MTKPKSYQQKVDLLLYLLYQKSKNGGGTIVASEAFEEYGYLLLPDEIRKMSIDFKNKNLGASQTAHSGVRFGISLDGEEFVENTSFSFPGTSVLNLDFINKN